MDPIFPAYDPTFRLPRGWGWTLLLVEAVAGGLVVGYRVAHPVDQPVVTGLQAALGDWSQAAPEQVALVRLVKHGSLTWAAVIAHLPEEVLRSHGLILVDCPPVVLLPATEPLDDLLTAA